MFCAKRMAIGTRPSYIRLLAGLVLAGMAALSAQPEPLAPIVETANGQIQGLSEYGVYSYRGIPYAAPPTGENRWRVPQPVANWGGVRDSTTFGNACIQKPGVSAENGGDPGPISEDCLYLNVWTLNPDAKRKKPVIVWIHGGAYVFGSGSISGYSGVSYAAKDIVFVSINYRLGPLGFFAHPAVEGEPGAIANFGLMDQIAALNWVQQNIAAFGGDPDNVTIMGQSAGAKSVMALYASPLARGLFSKGIAMSVYVLPDARRKKAEEVAAAIATAVGLKGAEATAAQLREVPAMEFAVLEGDGTSLGPVPIAGDLVLPASISETFAKGQEAALPLIVGSTSDDASVIAAFGLSPKEILAKLGAAGLGLKLLYPNMSDDERARQALRDIIFTMNPRWIADRHAKRAPTWRYYFDYVAEADREALPGGAPHGYEVAFFLETLPVADGIKDRYSERDMVIARQLAAYVADFARNGTPSDIWHPSDAKHDKIFLITTDFMKEKSRFMRHRLNTFVGVTKLIDGILGNK